MWISLLLAANMVLPLVFITTVEAQLVLAAAIAEAVTQTAIFASRGFVRLMGIGHIYWVPLIPWLWSQLDGFPPAGPFAMWLTSVMLLNSVSLIIDVGDVARYLNGDRTPHLTAG